ncbi:MAG TPA: TIM barrel protein [Bacteroidia bacterium]|jgi:sugar phosphate isomerase/epimerase
MIYVSSSCVKARSIGDSVRTLAQEGFTAIELSGGTAGSGNLEQELLDLKKEYGLSFLCHNYFPPPPQPFVINLASLDAKIAQMSIEHLQGAIALSAKLNAPKFGFHAGFLINIPVAEVGKSISKRKLFNRSEAFEMFCRNFNKLRKAAGEKVELYIENNVVSEKNLANYEGINPLFITDEAGFNEFRSRIDFRPLLDLAHLKVSCRSLGLDFERQASFFISSTDYIHVSDNDGRSDTNGPFIKGSAMYHLLERNDLKGKTFTLEVYSGIGDLKSSYQALAELAHL